MNKFWLRTISLLEIIGGTCGLLFVLIGPVFQNVLAGFYTVVPFFIAINILSLAAGIYLWKGTNFGRNTSIVVQFIQLPKIVSSYLVFSFSFGFDVFLQIIAYQDSLIPGVQFRLLTDDQLFILMDPSYGGFGISIVSIIFLFKLFTYSPELDNETFTPLDADPPAPDEYFNESGDPVKKE